VGISGTQNLDAVPTGYRLQAAYPNPFKPQTTIVFELPRQLDVTLRIFDVSGRLVRALVNGEILEPGSHESIWNGRDNTGRRVASGTYYYRLEAGDYSETKRMALIK
jgi:flagellar hook assembly protein FlgD